MGNIRKINIKNRTFYFFNDMVNFKDFDPNVLKIDKRSYKNTNFYYIGNITLKDSDYVKINRVNSLYLIISEANGYIKEKNGGKYSVFDSAIDYNEVFKKYAGLWYVIKNEIQTINDDKIGE